MKSAHLALALLLTLNALGLQAHAQGSLLTRVPVLDGDEVMQTRKNRIALDAAPLLFKGLGITYERQILSHVTLGPSFSFMQMDIDQMATYRHRVLNFAANARYFFKPETDKSGGYLLGGVGYSNVATEASFPNTSSDSTTVAVVGPVAGIGYQMVNSPASRIPLIFDLGLVYGPGHGVETSVATQGSRTRILEQKVVSSVAFEAKIGMTF